MPIDPDAVEVIGEVHQRALPAVVSHRRKAVSLERLVEEAEDGRLCTGAGLFSIVTENILTKYVRPKERTPKVE